jgi:DHA3 family tetracycline resistance protein-like MFS transporter
LVRRWNPYIVYLFLSGATAFLGSTIWVVGAVYYVLSVHMNPFQLVLVGTILEVSYLVAQVPTGIFADTYSRRLSIILGGTIMGFCWVGEGLFPLFIAIALAEAVRGLGAAFFDGAESAWLSDELGAEEFGRAGIRASQVGQMAGVAGMPAGVALASIHLNLPMAVGGVRLILLNIVLAIVMPERNFQRRVRQAVPRRAVIRATLADSSRLVRTTPLMLTLLAIALTFGAFSEGFDRLWEPHFLRDIPFPHLGHLTPIVWFGVINVAVALGSIVLLQAVHTWVDLNDHRATGRAGLALNAVVVAGVLTFALAGNFALAFAAFGVARMTRQLNYPIYTAWLNQRIADSSVRATVLSIQGSADAFGQSAVGPLIGLIGTLVSLRAAILSAGLILLPVLPLYVLALRGGPVEVGSAVEEQPA